VDDWSQIALFVVIIAVLYLVGRFLRGQGHVGGDGEDAGDGDGGGNGGD
jgi:hypothetical protein